MASCAAPLGSGSGRQTQVAPGCCGQPTVEGGQRRLQLGCQPQVGRVVGCQAVAAGYGGGAIGRYGSQFDALLCKVSQRGCDFSAPAPPRCLVAATLATS